MHLSNVSHGRHTRVLYGGKGAKYTPHEDTFCPISEHDWPKGFPFRLNPGRKVTSRGGFLPFDTPFGPSETPRCLPCLHLGRGAPADVEDIRFTIWARVSLTVRDTYV